MSKRFSGVKMTYQGIVLRSARFKDTQDNIDICIEALCLLLGLDEDLIFGREPLRPSLFEENGGRIEYYRETG